MSRKISFGRFLLMDGFAALISVPIWVYLGHFGAYNREWLMMWVSRGQTGLLVFAAIVVLTAIGFYLYQRWKRNIFAEPNK